MDSLFSLSTLTKWTEVYPGYWSGKTFQFWVPIRGFSLSYFTLKGGREIGELYWRTVRSIRP